jgi:hypothetical protein
MSNDDKETIRFHLQRLYGIALQHPREAERSAATYAMNEMLKIMGLIKPAKKE